MRHALGRIFLEVVGRQVVVVGADEGLEEPPGPARDHAQERHVLGLEVVRPGHQRPAHPPGQHRREGPQEQDRRRERQDAGLAHHQARRGRHRGRGGDPGGQVLARQVLARASLRVGGGAPFEEPATGQEPPGRAQDRDEVAVRVVGQAGQREGLAQELPH